MNDFNHFYCSCLASSVGQIACLCNTCVSDCHVLLSCICIIKCAFNCLQMV
uniref:Uncharacterized protein n=1 Tax=Arundo donax TaxID=35708 RepID=A0A0A8Z1D3_ARUDO